jgi:hypothetical protein
VKPSVPGKDPHGVRVGPVLPWLLPYVAIWGSAAGAVRVLDMSGTCTGFCAINAGVETYVVLLGAAVLSVLVASAELFLGRPH